MTTEQRLSPREVLYRLNRMVETRRELRRAASMNRRYKPSERELVVHGYDQDIQALAAAIQALGGSVIETNDSAATERT